MPLESYEGSSKDSLNEQIAALEAQLADLKKQLEATREASASSESAVDTGSSVTGASGSGSGPEYTVQSVAPSEVDGLRLYKWGRESITKAQVLEIVNGLKEPYNTEVSDFIKQNNIKGLQKYLNGKIDSGEIDLAGLKDAFTAKGIWLNGNHILEDGKFGPQTLETIRFFVKEQPKPTKPEEPENPDDGDESKEEEPSLDWIKEEMSDAMQDVKNRGRGNRSPERNSYDKNFEIDTTRSRVILRTWGISLHSSAKEHISDNRCEIDWKTGDMYIVCKDKEYKMPLHFGRFALDSKGYPMADNVNNREKVRAFTEVGNLMNMLKAQAVFNGKGAIEYQASREILPSQRGINLNDGLLGGETDTLLVSEVELNRLSNAYSHLGLKFDKATKVQIASLLSAMKYDLGKIKWVPDIESGRTLIPNPLDKEHVKWVKHYSKNYSRGA